MAVRIIEAAHYESESKAQGATPENMKAARSLVQAALDGRDDIVSYELVRNTASEPEYRPWIRVRDIKSGIRVIIEIHQEDDDDIVLMHAVLPRDSHTYDEIEKLWRQYRSKL